MKLLTSIGVPDESTAPCTCTCGYLFSTISFFHRFYLNQQPSFKFSLSPQPIIIQPPSNFLSLSLSQSRSPSYGFYHVISFHRISFPTPYLNPDSPFISLHLHSPSISFQPHRTPTSPIVLLRRNLHLTASHRNSSSTFNPLNTSISGAPHIPVCPSSLSHYNVTLHPVQFPFILFIPSPLTRSSRLIVFLTVRTISFAPRPSLPLRALFLLSLLMITSQVHVPSAFSDCSWCGGTISCSKMMQWCKVCAPFNVAPTLSYFV